MLWAVSAFLKLRCESLKVFSSQAEIYIEQKKNNILIEMKQENT